MRRALCVAGAAVLLSGCSLFVSKDDYLAYRATRTARDIDARLVAMAEYARSHPQGHYIVEIEAERRRQDTVTFERSKDTREGLEHYLRVLPDGAFAGQASQRLSAFAMIEERRAAEEARAAQAEQARRERERELRRTWVSRFVGYWGGALAGLSNWGAPIPEVAAANPRFSGAFGRSPRPRCTERECVKYYDAPYGIPVPGATRMERTMRLVLRLLLDKGRLVGAELLMPGRGFSRWYELESQQLVIDDDPEQRARAVQWAMEKLRAMITDLGSEAVPLDGFAMPAVAAPSIGPSGEQIDTSVDDPSAPSNRIAGTQDAAAASPEVEAALQPQDGPDLVVGAIRIGADGRAASEAVEAPAAPPGAVEGGEEGGGDVMVLDALSIPSGKPAAGAAPDTPVVKDGAATQGPALAAAAERVEAFRVGGLRIALRAAPVGQGPGFDVVWIRLADPLNQAP